MGKTKTIHIDEAIHNQLKEITEAKGLKLNRQIENIILEYIAKEIK